MNTIGEWVASLGLKQLRIAETEKYAHVTFFFSNGGREAPYEGEDRILVPGLGRDVQLAAEMSAPEKWRTSWSRPSKAKSLILSA